MSNGITETGAKSVAAYLAVTASLTSLDLCLNPIKDEGVAAIAASLKINTSLTHLDISAGRGGTSLREGLKITAKGATALAEMLSVNASLTRLDVSYNMLDRGGQGVKMLRDAVRGRQGFTLLDDDND